MTIHMSYNKADLICRKLAKRFNAPSHFDDLVSEGMLACLELTQKQDDIHTFEFVRTAKRAMHDYINIKCLPVSVPKHSVSRRFAHDIESMNIGNMSERSANWLKQIMAAEHVPFEDFKSHAPDHAEEYERVDFEQHIKKVAQEVLTTYEWNILWFYYWDDWTLHQIGDALGVTKQAIWQQLQRSIKKIFKAL